jgi:hypothetical protein
VRIRHYGILGNNRRRRDIEAARAIFNARGCAVEFHPQSLVDRGKSFDPGGRRRLSLDEGREVKEAVGRLMPRTARRIQHVEWGPACRESNALFPGSDGASTYRDAPRPHDLFMLQMLYKYSFDYVGGYVQSASLSQHLLEPACFIAIVRIF